MKITPSTPWQEPMRDQDVFFVTLVWMPAFAFAFVAVFVYSFQVYLVLYVIFCWLGNWYYFVEDLIPL